MDPEFEVQLETAEPTLAPVLSWLARGLGDPAGLGGRAGSGAPTRLAPLDECVERVKPWNERNAPKSLRLKG